MKIIGKIDGDRLLCEVSKDEVCRAFNQYSFYQCEDDLKEHLVVGGEVDLGKGYRFRDDIVAACGKMQDAVGVFGKAQKTLLAFSEMVVKANEVTSM